jgi:uncharacterized coiled-coil protein SlyX
VALVDQLRAWVDLPRNAALLPQILELLEGMNLNMAADRDMMAQLAADLDTLATPIGDVLTKYEAANARIAELEGQAAADEVADLDALQPVRAAYQRIADRFQAEPEVPDVAPLPEPPADGESQPV